MANTNVSFVGASQETAVEGPWTMGVTVSVTLTGGDRVLIKFPAAFDLSGVTTGSAFPAPGVAGVTFGGDFDPTTYTYLVAITDNLIDISIYSDSNPSGNLLPATGSGTITIAGITNPGPGVYDAADFWILTNKDGAEGFPAGDITITGGATAPSASTSQPSAVAATAMTLNGVVSSNGAETTVLFRYGTDPTLESGTSTVAATQSPLAEDASAAPVSAPLTSLANETLYVRVEATNSEGTTNGDIIAIAPLGNRYWIGGTGNWSAAANWSGTSGGSGGAGKPTRTVNAIFDANSFDGAGQTVTFDENPEFLSMDWTGATGVPELDCGTDTIQARCCGSLTFIDAMTVTGTLNETLGWLWDSNPPLATGAPTTNTIDTAGHTIPVLNVNPTTTVGMRMTGGGSWTLQSPLVQQVDDEGTHLYLRDGALDANGYDIDIRGLNNAETQGSEEFDIDLAGITLTIHDFVTLENPRGTIDVSGLNLITDPDIDYCIVNFREDTQLGSWYAGKEFGVGPVGFFIGNDLIVGAMTLEGGGLYATDDTIAPSGDLTVASLAVDGGAEGNLASLTGPLIASATLNADWLDLTDCPLSGETPGYAGANSEDNGGNTNWLFEPAPSDTVGALFMLSGSEQSSWTFAQGAAGSARGRQAIFQGDNFGGVVFR